MIYLVRGDMFQLVIQPSSGQLKVEYVPLRAHNSFMVIIYKLRGILSNYILMGSSTVPIHIGFISTFKHYIHATYKILHNKFLDFLTIENGTDRLFRNVGKELQPYAV